MGRLSEIVGPRSSGASSLLMALVARVTLSGGQVAFVDATDAFDPPSAVASGADLSHLLWIKCGGRLGSACRVADLLTHCPGFALVAIDLGELPIESWEHIPRWMWLRLQRALEGSPTMLVLRSPHRLTGSLAALVLSVRRLESRWIGRPHPRRFAGLVSETFIVRSRAGDARSWVIEWSL
jgi:hypothetical protein